MPIVGTSQPLNRLRITSRGFSSSGRVTVTLTAWMKDANILHRILREETNEAIKAVAVENNWHASPHHWPEENVDSLLNGDVFTLSSGYLIG
jgi:hypothetical protein